MLFTCLFLTDTRYIPPGTCIENKSPRYPEKYPNNKDIRWKYTVKNMKENSFVNSPYKVQQVLKGSELFFKSKIGLSPFLFSEKGLVPTYRPGNWLIRKCKIFEDDNYCRCIFSFILPIVGLMEVNRLQHSFLDAFLLLLALEYIAFIYCNYYVSW